MKSDLIEDSNMHRPFLCVVRVVAWSFCLHLAAAPAPGATPPPARNRHEVEAVLAQTPQTPPAAPVAPDPHDPNLLLWLDAADQATLTVSPDGHVSAWANKSAKVGRQLTSSGTQTPRYVAKALGGHPALRFDGTDDVLRDTAFGQSAQTWSLVLVVTPRSNAGNGQFHALIATNRPGQQDYQSGLNLDFGGSGTTQFDTLNLEGVKHQGGAGNLRTESAPFGEGQIVLLATNNERSRLWINGREEDSRTANDAVTAMDELRVGARFFWGREGGYFHGDVSEVLLYKAAPSR